MKTSVVVCTRNRLNEVLRFCDSLYRQTELPDEFLLIDSSDTPMERDSVLNGYLRDDKIKLIYVHRMCGLTAARNAAVKKASGDVLYFFDDDVILEPAYLQVMNATYAHHPEYMGGMGAITGVPRSSLYSITNDLFRRFFLLQHEKGNGKFYRSGLPQHPYGTDKFLEVEVLGGCAMSYRKELFGEFAFDESMFGYSYMEDDDFSRKVSYKHKLFFNSAARLEHRHGIGGRADNIVQNRKMFMTNYRYVFFKNFYSKSRWNLIFHWWAMAGLFLMPFIFSPSIAVKVTKGYIEGNREFNRKRREILH
jgi:GT2 family glycosyltransferase